MGGEPVCWPEVGSTQTEGARFPYRTHQPDRGPAKGPGRAATRPGSRLRRPERAAPEDHPAQNPDRSHCAGQTATGRWPRARSSRRKTPAPRPAEPRCGWTPSTGSKCGCPARSSTWRTRPAAGTACPARSISHTAAMRSPLRPRPGRFATTSAATRRPAAGTSTPPGKPAPPRPRPSTSCASSRWSRSASAPGTSLSPSSPRGSITPSFPVTTRLQW
jgi:hypothetical protein